MVHLALQGGVPSFGGRYSVIKQIGSGGMGRIFLAEDLTLGRKVAIKLIREDYAGESQFVERFWREARAAAAIEHSNIVQVFEVGRSEEGLPFIVMEALDGRDLRRELRAEGRLPFDRSVDVAGQILFALAAAHRAGVVHRDLKPGNVFLARREVASLSELDRGAGGETVKLLDFGISRFLEQRAFHNQELTSKGDVLGTFKYMAPEQLDSSRDVDGRADLYSLGVILYECVTGQSPFGDEGGVFAVMKRALQQPIRPVHEVVRGVPQAFTAVLERALAHSPAERYRDATAFVEALRPFHDAERHRGAPALVRDDDASADELDDSLVERARRLVAEVPTAALRQRGAASPPAETIKEEQTVDESPTEIAEEETRVDESPTEIAEEETRVDESPAEIADEETRGDEETRVDNAAESGGQEALDDDFGFDEAKTIEAEGFVPQEPVIDPLGEPQPSEGLGEVSERQPLPFGKVVLIIAAVGVVAGVSVGFWVTRGGPPGPDRPGAEEATTQAVVLPAPVDDGGPPAVTSDALGEQPTEASPPALVEPAQISADAGPGDGRADSLVGEDAGPLPASSLALALERFERRDYEGCLEALRAVPAGREAGSLRRRCTLALRRAQGGASRPGVGREPPSHAAGTGDASPSRPVEAAVRRDPPPAEAEGPFARDAPW